MMDNKTPALKKNMAALAACVFEKVFRDPERPLVVRHADFTHLRLHLLLIGADANADDLTGGAPWTLTAGYLS